MKSKIERKSSSKAIKEAGYGATKAGFHICPRVSAIGRTNSNNDIGGVKKKAPEEPYWKYHM